MTNYGAMIDRLIWCANTGAVLDSWFLKWLVWLTIIIELLLARYDI